MLKLDLLRDETKSLHSIDDNMGDAGDTAQGDKVVLSVGSTIQLPLSSSTCRKQN